MRFYITFAQLLHEIDYKIEWSYISIYEKDIFFDPH